MGPVILHLIVKNAESGAEAGSQEEEPHNILQTGAPLLLSSPISEIGRAHV